MLFSSYKYDMFIVDQVSACIPVLMLVNKPILFYCHFPDLKLSPRKSLLKKIYRFPIDYLEQFTTGCADKILVNSNYTKTVFKETFSFLERTPEILYPTVKFKECLKYTPIKSSKNIFVSINRFERKKNIKLAIKSLWYL
eukprot:UN27580